MKPLKREDSKRMKKSPGKRSEMWKKPLAGRE